MRKAGTIGCGSYARKGGAAPEPHPHIPVPRAIRAPCRGASDRANVVRRGTAANAVAPARPAG